MMVIHMNGGSVGFSNRLLRPRYRRPTGFARAQDGWSSALGALRVTKSLGSGCRFEHCKVSRLGPAWAHRRDKRKQ